MMMMNDNLTTKSVEKIKRSISTFELRIDTVLIGRFARTNSEPLLFKFILTHSQIETLAFRDLYLLHRLVFDDIRRQWRSE